MCALLLVELFSTCGEAQDEPERISYGDAVKIVAPITHLEVTERTAKNVEFTEWVTRVDGFDPKVISVTALDKQVLRVQGLEQGLTTMAVTDKTGATHTIEVFVSGDARLLQAMLARAFPNSVIQATMLRGNAVLLRGWVTEAQQISSITELAELYSPKVVNQVRVGGPQEVQLRVKIMEVQRSKIRTFGFNFAASASSFALASTIGQIAPLSALTAPIGGPPTAIIGPNGLNPPTLSAGITGKSFGFEGFLQALKEEGLLKIQAEPVLVTRSGEAAQLDNGGEFPVPVPQSLGTVTIEWREFGVILKALPIVISPTRLRQQVEAEVSERDVANGVTLAGTFVPGLTRRRVASTVEMEFGQTLVLGGLVSTRTVASTSKTPFFGELPLIGAAFSKKKMEVTEVELIIMITPEYVSSISSDQLPPLGPGLSTTTPTDRELFCTGLIEVPAVGPECPVGDSWDPSFSVKVKSAVPESGKSGASETFPNPATIAPPAVPLLSTPELFLPSDSGDLPETVPSPPAADPSLSSGSAPKQGQTPGPPSATASDTTSTLYRSRTNLQPINHTTDLPASRRVQPVSARKSSASKPLSQPGDVFR